MTLASDVQADPVFDLLAKLHLTLGHMEEKLTADRKDRHALSQAITPLWIDGVDVATSGTTDRPNILGPRPGWVWAIHALVPTGIAAGAITVWRGLAGSTQMNYFTTTAPAYYGKGQFNLQAGDRLVLVGSSTLSTGASISIGGVQIAAPWFSDYAL